MYLGGLPLTCIQSVEINNLELTILKRQDYYCNEMKLSQDLIV